MKWFVWGKWKKKMPWVSKIWFSFTSSEKWIYSYWRLIDDTDSTTANKLKCCPQISILCTFEINVENFKCPLIVTCLWNNFGADHGRKKQEGGKNVHIWGVDKVLKCSRQRWPPSSQDARTWLSSILMGKYWLQGSWL